MKLEFSRQILEKYSNIKFQEKASSGIRVLPYEHTRTIRQYESNNRFSPFCEHLIQRTLLLDPLFAVSIGD